MRALHGADTGAGEHDSGVCGATGDQRNADDTDDTDDGYHCYGLYCYSKFDYKGNYI